MSHSLETTNQTANESVALIKTLLNENRYHIA